MDNPEDAASVADGSEDYKALYEIEQARNVALTADWEKAGKDFSSIKGTLRSQTARDADIVAEIKSLKARLGVMAEAQASGDASSLSESLTRLDGESQAEADQRAFAVEYDEVYGELQSALGKVSLDSPEAAAIKALWTEGFNDQTLTASQKLSRFNKAVGLAYRLVPAKVEEDPPPEEDNTDDLGTDTGAGSQGASKTLATLMKKDPKKMTVKERDQYLKDLYLEAGKNLGVTFKTE